VVCKAFLARLEQEKFMFGLRLLPVFPHFGLPGVSRSAGDARRPGKEVLPVFRAAWRGGNAPASVFCEELSETNHQRRNNDERPPFLSPFLFGEIPDIAAPRKSESGFLTETLTNTVLRAVQRGELAGKGIDSRPLGRFGLLVRRLRRQRGLSLESLAELARMDADLVLAIELGTASFRQVKSNLPRLERALGCQPLALTLVLVELALRDR
jgi:hypothetical protein